MLKLPLLCSLNVLYIHLWKIQVHQAILFNFSRSIFANSWQRGDGCTQPIFNLERIDKNEQYLTRRLIENYRKKLHQLKN